MHKQTNEICIRAKKNVFSHLGGIHLGKQKSTGLDFASLRDYEMGDDLRHISWSSYAKTRRLITKEFTEQRRLNIRIISLLSANMIFGQHRQKQEILADALAHLIFSALQKNDNLSAGIFTQRLSLCEKITNQNQAKEHIAKILSFDLIGQKIDYTSLNEHLIRLQKPSLLILLGDFLDENFCANALAYTCKKHELVMLALRDKLEEDLLDLEFASFIDPISQKSLLGKIDAKTRQQYCQALNAFDAKTLDFAYKNMVRFAKIYTHENTYKRLRQIFD